MAQAQVVQKYRFTTRGNGHEVAVTRQTDNPPTKVTWSVNADDNLAGSQTVAVSSQECMLGFKVKVKGSDPNRALDCLLIITADQSVPKLMVHQTEVEPWWTIQRGDIHQDKPVEVLEGEPPDVPAPNNQPAGSPAPNSYPPVSGTPYPNGNLPPQNMSVPQSAPPKQNRKWWACCAAEKGNEELILRGPTAQSGLYPQGQGRPRGSYGNKPAPLQRPESPGRQNSRQQNEKPKSKMTTFVSEDIPQQCNLWAAEVFQE